MSKMDAVRAMREARYAEAQARSATPKTPTPKTPKTPTQRTPAKKAGASPAEETDGLCGHRNMSGRTCTREQGHPQKSHRYS
ncbi:hypothetical protein [Nocardioides sp. LML1-1-1.1]|uniref:hypothetical protein n=1 Tax=Nocardioides sp. LML1-1-1.1 TaxID=3135248 RepID=UPI003412675F